MVRRASRRYWTGRFLLTVGLVVVLLMGTPASAAPVLADVTTAADTHTDTSRDGSDEVGVGVARVNATPDTHESGVPRRVFDAAAAGDGLLTRSDLLRLVRDYVAGDGQIDGVNVDRTHVLALVRYYVELSSSEPTTPGRHPDDPGVSTRELPDFADYGDSINSSQVEREMFGEINDMRTGNLTASERRMYNLSGSLALPAWERRASVASAARAHSAHMAHEDYFSHTTPDGKQFYEWYYDDMDRPRHTCPAMAQNIAYTPVVMNEQWDHVQTARTDDPDESIARWILRQFMHSGPHKQTLTMSRDGAVGIGVHIEGSHLYTTQNMCGE